MSDRVAYHDGNAKRHRGNVFVKHENRVGLRGVAYTVWKPTIRYGPGFVPPPLDIIDEIDAHYSYLDNRVVEVSFWRGDFMLLVDVLPSVHFSGGQGPL